MGLRANNFEVSATTKISCLESSEAVSETAPSICTKGTAEDVVSTLNYNHGHCCFAKVRANS